MQTTVWKRSGSSSGASTSPCRWPRSRARCRSGWRGSRKTVKVAGFRPGQGAAQDGRAAIRPAGALGRDFRARAGELHRCDPRAEPARRRLSAYRAAARRRRGRPMRWNSRRCSRSIPRCKIGDLSRRRDRASGGRGDAGGRRSHARDAARAAHDVTSPWTRAAQHGDRVTVDFTGTIDGVEFPGGQAHDFPIMLGEGRMLPEFEAA